MESYIELTFLHNIFIHSFSLSLSNIYSKRYMSKKLFVLIILVTTLLPSILYIPYSSTIIWINEILIFLLFKNRISTYIYYVGFRLLFIILFYFIFNGTIYHNQYFLFDISALYFDLILLILYISILCKIKYKIIENDFIYPFKLNNKKYIGYMDTGNQATYEHIPVIFLKESIFNQLDNNKILIDIETINGTNKVETIKQDITINSHKITVYCSKISNDFEYDALLNLKGLLWN